MKLKFLSKKQETPDVYSFVFHPDAEVSWKPGQYLHYEFPHVASDERGTERYFTISAAPFEKNIMLTTRLAGDKGSSFKDALMNLAEGDELEADGPKGEFVLEEGDVRHILIAGGIGITPYRSMLAQLDHDGERKNIDLLYLNRGENLAFGDFFRGIEKKWDSFQMKTFIGDRKIEKADLETDITNPRAIFYLSGPKGMVESYQHLLESDGLDKQRVKTDYFPGY